MTVIVLISANEISTFEFEFLTFYNGRKEILEKIRETEESQTISKIVRQTRV